MRAKWGSQALPYLGVKRQLMSSAKQESKMKYLTIAAILCATSASASQKSEWFLGAYDDAWLEQIACHKSSNMRWVDAIAHGKFRNERRIARNEMLYEFPKGSSKQKAEYCKGIK